MTETPIILNVHFQAASGHEENLGAALRSLVAPTRAEPGCLVYELHFDPIDPSKFMFYEKFASQAALDQHTAAPYLEKFWAYLKAHNPVVAQTVTRWQSCP